MCLEARGCLAVACGGGGARGRGRHFTDPAGSPSVTGGPSQAKSRGLHRTSKANPVLISVGICDKKTDQWAQMALEGGLPVRSDSG